MRGTAVQRAYAYGDVDVFFDEIDGAALVAVERRAPAPLAGRACDRAGIGPVMVAGFAALLLSALMQSAFGASTPWPWVLAAFACMGLGWGCVLGPSMTAALAALPQALAGTALGMATTLHNVGGALGLAIGTVLYRHAAQGGGFIARYRLVMLLLVAVCLCAMAVLALAGRVGKSR